MQKWLLSKFLYFVFKKTLISWAAAPSSCITCKYPMKTEYVGSGLCTRVCLDAVFYGCCPHTLPPWDLASHIWGHFSLPRGEVRGRAEALTGQHGHRANPLRD